MTENDLIAFDVREMAAQIFFECGAADDYCVQSYGSGSALVFGGTNRLILDDNGWRVDPSYCTPEFLERWEARKNNDQG